MSAEFSSGGRNHGSSRYRADIDGLRALAIIPVVAYHAFPGLAPGGFVGVDIFFVVSGFLISGIIFASLEDETFSFADFYARRIRRIFPALLIVIATCFAFGWYSLLPNEFKQLGKHIAASAGFLQNIFLWKESGYFDTASELKPLLHLWSLAIEEQYYLVFPLMTWFIWRRKINLFATICLIALVSFAMNIHEARIDSIDAFYLPHARFWELLVGSILAYRNLRGKPTGSGPFARLSATASGAIGIDLDNDRVKSAVSGIGCVSILAGIFLLNRNDLYPGWRALLPVAGAALVIWSGPGAWINANILSARPTVFIGKISYPLYLWHWPLLAFARIVHPSSQTADFLVPLVSASFLLAWLTYILVERPIRFGMPAWRKPVVVVLCVLMIGAMYFGKEAYRHEGYAGRTRDWKSTNLQLSAEARKKDEWTISDEACRNQHAEFSFCLLSRASSPSIAIIGDSHANQLFPGLADAAAKYERASIINAGFGSALPVANVVQVANASDQTIGQRLRATNGAVAMVEATPSIHWVILAARWSTSFPQGNLGSPSHEKTLRLSDRPDLSDPHEIMRIGLENTLARLLDKHKDIILVLDNAELGFDPETCLYVPPLRFWKMRPNCAVSRKEFDDKNREYRELFAEVLRKFPSVRVFDIASLFCDDSLCWAEQDGKLLYRDGDHLSLFGSEVVAQALVRKYPELLLQ